MGLSKLCPTENVSKIDRRVLLTYLKNHYVPERIVIGGVGVDHQQLVESVQKYLKHCYLRTNNIFTYALHIFTLRYFVDKKPIWNNEQLEEISIDNSIPQYTGGIIKVCVFLIEKMHFHIVIYKIFY